MEKIPIAIISGGAKEERSISLKSADFILNYIDRDRYDPYLIYMDGPRWYEATQETSVDKNDFSITLQGRRVHFTNAILIIHGTPVEDGKIQGYFDALGIKYQCCNTFCSALTFHKMACKRFLQPLGVPLADSILLRKGTSYTLENIMKWEFPLFVKPNQQGSSFGVTFVKTADQLDKAIANAFEFDHEIMIERAITGREFGCGVMKYQGKTIAFPLTEIIPYGAYFDWDAKYENKSDEITPADLSEELTKKCQDQSIEIYDHLGCSGVIRIDYILEGNDFYFLEVNTTPGLSPTSIIPQMARAYGWSNHQLIQAIIDGII
jgi:D-alanine-D-alanine ligase